MTLTVRLPESLEATLNRYCAERGVTKSLVVQESLTTYLLASASSVRRGNARRAGGEFAVSANYQAFADAGFIGAGELGGGSADKAAVRAKAMRRIRRIGR